MLSNIQNIIYFVIVLGFLIFVHELGHFLVAKLSDVKVLTFSLGFGKKLLRFRKGDTEYALSAVPLGGYVKLLGEGDDKEVPPEEAHRSFSNKPPLVRMLIAFTGPFFNLLFAFVLFLCVFSITGYPIPSTQVGTVIQGDPAERAGIMPGDTIVGINGVKTEYFDDIMVAIKDSAAGPITVSVQRENRAIEFTLTPKTMEEKNILGDTFKRKVIGVTPSGTLLTKRESPPKAFISAVGQTYMSCKLTVIILAKIVQGAISAKNIGGPIAIFQETGKRAKQGISDFLNFLGLLSVNLAIINLLPIPILDGGHILFQFIELITRKKIPERAIEIAQKFGLVILILIMALAFYNDLDRLFDFKRFIGGR
jgi:regulator of sigma E protease